jgi:CHAT domain-containing protein
MQQLTFAVTQKTDDRFQLRLLDASGTQLLGERELDSAFVGKLAAVVEKYYRRETPNLVELGQQLYQWLDGATERWLAQVATHADGTALHIDVAEQLRHLPWELLNQQGAYLCQNAHRPFTPVRRVNQHQRDYPRANRPLRLLFMACSAVDIKPVLSYEHEEICILAAANHSDIELLVEERGSQAGLAERLSDYGDDEGKGYFDVFHLTGHADVDAATQQPFFWMEDDLGFGAKVTADELARAFGRNWPRLVFLSGCKTAQASDSGLLPSFCEALVAAGAPAVLGWALPVSDVYATEAAAELYKHLAAGMRVDEAVARARFRLLENRRADWHLLRLYTDRTPATELVTAPRTKGRQRVRVRDARSEWLDENQRSEVCPRSEFIGRRRPLQRCLRALTRREGEPFYAPGVLIHGMGGLGKSSLAARLCDRLPDHRRLFWYGAVDELGFTAKLGEKLNRVEVNQMLSQPLPLRQRVQHLFDAGVFDEPALLIFDDFEQNLEEDANGGWQLKKDALDILTALLAAIRNTRSDSRVLITSRYRFPLPHPLRLYEEGLESLTEADLSKKLRQLEAKYDMRLAQGDAAHTPLLAQAQRLGAGNPRLLERLYRVLADAETDHATLFAALEQTAEAFREEIFLRKLLAAQTPACRQLIAAAALVRLPVDRAALDALAGPLAVDPHLERAVTLGLIEAGTVANPQTGGYEKQYFVSELLLPLVESELTEAETHAARQRAAQRLYQQWWVETKSRNLEQALEVHRLALLAGEREIAVQLCDSITTHWVNRAQYRDAVMLCEVTLAFGEDYRILHNLARAEAVLGSGNTATHYQQALANCPPEDVKERSAIIHNFASLLLQQGEVGRALGMWQESLALKEQIGDVQGKAATLHQMAWAAGRTGNRQEERRLNLEAGRALAHIRAWLDLVTAGAVLFAHTRGERHPEREKYQRAAFNLLVACAGERGITTQDAFDAWVATEGLLDPQRFVPQLDAALVALVGEGEWLFDRALLAN